MLWPRPQRLRETGERVRLPAAPVVDPGPAGDLDHPAADRIETALSAAGPTPRSPTPGDGARAAIRLRLDPQVPLRSEAYRLEPRPDGFDLIAADRAGLLHASSTLAQWITLHRETLGTGGGILPAIEIEDWPDLPARGVLLDISRNKVPSMETLRRLVDLLSGWKINQLQLYTEHTFAYRGHEAVWRGASAVTAAEARELDAYCRHRGVELVPNQNSFGHLHRWLVHPSYRQLAECPDGVEHPWSSRPEPFSLCPTDHRSLELLADLYDQLLPQFSSRQVNVGLDETLDLGQGRSAEACAQRGAGAIYLDFLRAIHRLLAARGRRMQFWADMLSAHPEVVDGLPADVVPLVWGYEADHPFAEGAAPLAARGLRFYLCPGTSSWSSFAGRTRNALLNLSQAAGAAVETGAGGILITDWGDHGHLQPLAVSYLGLLAGAGFGWNQAAAEMPLEIDTAALLDAWAFGCEGLGAAARDLGEVYRLCGALPRNGSALFHLVVSPHDDLTHARYRGLDRVGLEQAAEAVERSLASLAALPPVTGEPSLARRELAWSGEMLALACRLGAARLQAGARARVSDLASPVRRALARQLDALAERHRELWLARNRPGGLEDSRRRLALLEEMLP